MFLKTAQTLPYRLDNHHIIDFIFSLKRFFSFIKNHNSYNVKKSLPHKEQALHI